MQKIPLGKSNLEISRLALGTWQVSGWATSNENEFKKVVEKALEAGINFIDTAPAYGNGQAERLIGKVLEKYDRSKYVIATKFLHSQSSKEKLIKVFEQSLINLKTDYIDLYQQHWPSSRIEWAETEQVLLDLKKAGKIREIGVCNWTEPEWSKISDYSNITTLQPCYNLLWRQVEKNIIPICEKNKIAIIPYSPLAQGLLATATWPNELPKDHRKKCLLFEEEKRAIIEPILNLIKKLAKEYKVSPAEISLSWLLSKKPVSSIIIGCSNLEQLEINIKSLELKLNSADLDSLDQVSKSFSDNLKPHDTLWGWHPN
jgi:aryl-alcohol dehydrogenase-like predicted oxidoreductase